MATVDTLLVEIKADMSDLRKQLNQARRTVQESTDKQKKSFISLGTAVKGVLGGAVAIAVARFGMNMVNMASAVEEMQAKSEVVFGQFVGNVRKELEEFGDAVGRSRFELEGMASSVQDTFVPLGFARGEASQLSTQLTKLAVDVASFNNVQDADAMRSFQSALVGNHEAVRRFGIVITEAELKQELFRMGITKNINQVTAQEKVQARLNLIIAGTADAQGDAERTSGSFANSSRALRAQLETLGTEIGQEFLPAMTRLVQITTSAVISIRDFLREMNIIGQIDTATRIEKLNEELKELEDNIQKNEKHLEGLSDSAKKYGSNALEKMIEKDKQEVSKLKQEIADLTEAQKKLNKATAKTEDTTKITVTANQTYMNTVKKLKEEQKLLNLEISGATELQILQEKAVLKSNATGAEQIMTIENLISANASLSDSLKEINDATTSSKSFLESLKTEEEKLKKQQEDLNIAFLEGKITLDEFNKGTKELNEQLFLTSDEGKLALQAIDGLSSGLADTLVNALETGKLSLRDLGNVVKDVMAEMARDFIKAQIRAMILKAVLASMGGGPTAGGGGMDIGGTFAGGGTVQPKKPILVGERGPEIFVPNTGGTIKNNMDSKNMGGNTVVVNQNVNFTTGVVPTVRAEVINMLPIIKRETMNAVADAKQRGGSFAQALGSN